MSFCPGKRNTPRGGRFLTIMMVKWKYINQKHFRILYQLDIRPRMQESHSCQEYAPIWDEKIRFEISVLSLKFEIFLLSHPILKPYSWQERDFCILGRIVLNDLKLPPPKSGFMWALCSGNKPRNIQIFLCGGRPLLTNPRFSLHSNPPKRGGEFEQ